VKDDFKEAVLAHLASAVSLPTPPFLAQGCAHALQASLTPSHLLELPHHRAQGHLSHLKTQAGKEVSDAGKQERSRAR
jgi:hypothetical protein